ncbi:MAG: hypothetical protein H7Z75_05005 [Ferruginibacter sp.]|nr:hypothetical protein [Cytophagales bacterium]
MTIKKKNWTASIYPAATLLLIAFFGCEEDFVARQESTTSLDSSPRFIAFIHQERWPR